MEGTRGRAFQRVELFRDGGFLERSLLETGAF